MSVILSCRTHPIPLSRQTLVELPESVLLCLFPNGVTLAPPAPPGKEGEERVYEVDFDPACLTFILSFFDNARSSYQGPSLQPAHLPPNPLFTRQAVIVLREDLEYFVIPNKSLLGHSTDSKTINEQAFQPSTELLNLKKNCGNALLEKRSIFTALQRNVNRENNLAEQHLIDMLCMSGFNSTDTWGFRTLEPNRCCISSIALVLLKTGISYPSSSNGKENEAKDPEPIVDQQQLATAQKLLLFWKKPARKCWWDTSEFKLDEAESGEGDSKDFKETNHSNEVKVWARRVWTLELSLL